MGKIAIIPILINYFRRNYSLRENMMRKLLNSELGRKSIQEFREAAKVPVIIVLDNIRSQSNIGSVFRTADAFLVEAVYLCGITARPPHREIQKTALGATETVYWKYYDTTTQAVDELKKNGFTIVAVEQAAGAVQLQELKLDLGRKYALIFGHEINGVGQEIINTCDLCVEIPQFGTKHSFNIAVSAGIVLWEVCKVLTPGSRHNDLNKNK